MKKLLALLLVLVMCLMLCACDVDAIMDGVSDMLDGDDGDDGGQQENVVYDQMIPAGDANSSDEGGIIYNDESGVITIVTDQDGNIISGNGVYEFEIIDGVAYVNGVPVETQVVSGEGEGGGSFSFGYGTGE